MSKSILRACLLVTAATLPSFAHAQSAAPAADANNGTQLGDIVVTAQRRSENLQKVPLAVTALDATALSNKGITNINNLSTSVSPGVVITSFGGTASTLSLNIRGVYSADPGIGLQEQGVALYEDGVPLGRAIGAGIDLGDIERIEVLRGPQGTLFGRNAEGGAVQFVTKKPSGKFGGRVELQAGNFNQRKVLAVLDLPEVAGFSVKLSGLIDKRDGFTANLQPRPGVDYYTGGVVPDYAFHQERSDKFADLGLKDQRGFRVAVQYAPVSNFKANYTFDFSDLAYTVVYNSRSGGRVPSAYAWCVNPTYAATCASGASIISNIYYDTPSAQPLNPKFVDVPTYEPESTNHARGHNLTLEYNASNEITFKSISGLRTMTENGFTNLGTAQVFVQTIPTSAFASNIGGLAGVTGTLAPAEIHQKQFSEELQMLGNFGDLKLTAGLFYYYERVIDSRSSFFALGYRITGPTTALPVAIDPLDFGGITPSDGLTGSFQTYNATAHSYAAYAQGTYTPSSIFDGNLSITGGIRYTKDKKHFIRVRAAGGIGNGATSDFDGDRFDPAVTLAYQITPDVNVYARYASAYRAGGSGIRNKLALTTYAPEVNKSVEIGFKSVLFDRRLRFNVAAFHNAVKNLQVSFQNSNLDPSSTDVVNATGTIKVNGVEIESTAQITPELTFSAGYSYMHASTGNAVVGGPVQTATGIVFQSSALPTLPYLPNHQLNLSADYTRPMGDAKFFTHLEYNYSSDYENAPNGVPNAQEAKMHLSQFNGRIGFRDIPAGPVKVSIEAFGNNLFNAHEYSYAYQIGSSDFTVGLRNDPGGSGYAFAPRTFGLLAKVAF